MGGITKWQPLPTGILSSQLSAFISHWTGTGGGASGLGKGEDIPGSGLQVFFHFLLTEKYCGLDMEEFQS